MNRIFRKTAIDRLSSPEQLDTMARITTPKNWLSLSAVLLLIALAVVWAFTGTQAEKISGAGVLVKPGGIAGIGAAVEGQITDVRVRLNDRVERGDVIARTAQPELLAELAELRKQLAVAEQAGDEAAALIVQEQVRGTERLYESQSRIVSPYSGRIIEVGVKKYDWISPGLPVAVVELDNGASAALQPVMYVPAQVGKRVRPGMEVQVFPTSVNKEEYGYLLGQVVSVSEYPASPQSMMLTLGNAAYVAELSQAATALLEVRVELETDATTPSGYRWSTRQGPPLRMESGTPMTASITVLEQRPIANLLPGFN